MQKQTREQRPGHFPGTLWTSTGRIRNELKCEEEYFQQELCTTESPSVKYRFPEGLTPGHLTATQHDKQSRKRRVPRSSKLEKKSGESSGDLWEEENEAMRNRPFTTSLRQDFQMDSREALCLLGLKKKIARMFADNVSTLDEIHRCTFGNGYGAKRPSPVHSEATPVKRRRGRPPKKKNSLNGGTPKTPQSNWKCIADNQQPLRVKISRSKSSSDAAILQRDAAAASVVEGSVSLRAPPPRPLRKVRTVERATTFINGDDTSSDSSPDPDPISSLPPVDDEALALQLHLDLNAPRLRRRRRSGGLLSPSSSEQ